MGGGKKGFLGEVAPYPFRDLSCKTTKKIWGGGGEEKRNNLRQTIKEKNGGGRSGELSVLQAGH